MSFLFGKTPEVKYTPPSFSSSGLSATFGGGGYKVSDSSATQSAVSGLQDTFQQQGNAFGAIGSQWQPGFSNLRKSLMDILQSSKTQGLGDLRQNLSQRRVLGSSFAQNSLANAASQYDQEQAKVMADTYLQELDATMKTTQAQYQSYAQSFTTALTQMNFDTGIAAQLTGQASAALAQVAQTNAKLQAESQAGMGKLFGTLAGFALAPFTGGTSLLGSFGSLSDAGLNPFGSATGSGGFNFMDAAAGTGRYT